MSDKVKCNQCPKLFKDADALSEHRRVNHPVDITDAALDQAARGAIYQCLTSTVYDKGVYEKAKIAAGHRSTEARKEQAKGAQEATLAMMARELSTNPEEFKNYMRVALPSAPFWKALPSGDGRPS